MLLTPEQMHMSFKKDISKETKVLKWLTFLYFGIALAVAAPLLYICTSYFDQKLIPLATLLISGIAIISAGTLCLWLVHRRLKKINITSPIFNWHIGAFRDWQKQQIRIKSGASNNPSNQSWNKALDLYIEYINDKISNGSPFIEPAIIMAFIMPLYSFALKRYFDYTNSPEQLLTALSNVIATLIFIFSLYFLGKGFIALVNVEREIQTEFLGLLTEIKFEHDISNNDSDQ